MVGVYYNIYMHYKKRKGGSKEQKTDSQNRGEDCADKDGPKGDRPDPAGPAAPPVQGSPTPRRCLLADQLYASDEERHRVRPPGMGEGPSSPDRQSQAIQASD